MNFITKYKLAIIGIVIGAIGGLLYWKFVGCTGGSCAITSKPFNSGVYGAMMGGLLFSSFKKEEKNTSDKNEGSEV